MRDSRMVQAAVGVAISVLCWCPSGALGQAPQMTSDQARQALLPYVQDPDTTLGTVPVASADAESGHTEYLFYGDSCGGFGGLYRIDATSGAKHIQYCRHSNWDNDPADTPTPLTSEQIVQHARDFAALHFAAYASAELRNQNGGRTPDPVRDGDIFSVAFGVVPPSGAELPVLCWLNVEEDTGRVQYYTEQDIPVTISTNPALTEGQAVQSAQDWIYQNVSTEPEASELLPSSELGGDPAVYLRVYVDDAMDEFLGYNVSLESRALIVDAQSGNVIEDLTYVGAIKLGAGPAHRLDQQEQFLGVCLGKPGSEPGWPAVRVGGRTYLSEAYLRLLGVTQARHASHFDLSRAGQRVQLSVRITPAPIGDQAWERKKVLYVPLDVVHRLCPQVQDGSIVKGTPVALNLASFPANPLGDVHPKPGELFRAPRSWKRSTTGKEKP